MADLALKRQEVLVENGEEFPFRNLLTKALVESFCPILKSEIVFGKLEKITEDAQGECWIEALVRGDLEGRIAISCKKTTLLALVSNSNQGTTPHPSLIKSCLAGLHEALALNFEKQFSEEALRCDLKKGTGYQENYLIPKEENLFCCPLDTHYGQFQVWVSLSPSSKELKKELESHNPLDPSKKIRVYSSQIDSFVDQVKVLERLEQKLLQGPEVRSQLRGQIKKMKRLLHQLRTESLETVFVQAKKVANELSKSQGKQVELEVTGAWLHLHKSLLNLIYEPILHLIRNAVDHGIEDPLRREKNGKKAVGRISILASFNQGILRIIFSDDGGGLHFGAIREKAIVRGIFSAEEANAKANEELSELIFQAGFSTKKQSSTVSGRGLGLDSVKKALEGIGGSLRLVSTSLHGTSFELLIPINEDFSPVSSPKENALLKREEEEKTQLLDELSDYQDRFSLALQALFTERTLQSAYEAYRIAHLMKGVSGFLGWQRVLSFLYPFEEVLKLISEEKVALSDSTLFTINEASQQLKGFLQASRNQNSFPLNKVRSCESRLLQLIWGASQNDEKTHLFLGKYHLSAVESFFLALAKNGSFSVRPETSFNQALQMPFAALVQFSGDRRGFAGIYLPEKTLREIIHPLVTGSRERLGHKKALGSLAEFGNLMGAQFVDACSKAGINLQSASPLTYYGVGEPMRALGMPTYCFQCEINGYPFYLAGDFRLPPEMSETLIPASQSLSTPEAFQCLPQVVSQTLSQFGIQAVISEEASQSDLIGFDGGVTSIISLMSEDKLSPDAVVFLSFDGAVGDHLKMVDKEFFDSLQIVNDQLSTRLQEELGSRKTFVKPNASALFVGKAYVANFNRLFVTNKLVGNSSQGRIEVQVLFTEFVEDKLT